MTESVAVGFAPVPAVKILYCRPSGKVTTPSLLLLAARNASPSLLFLAEACSIFSCCSLRTSFCISVRTACASSCVRRGLAPDKASFIPWDTSFGSTSTDCFFKLTPPCALPAPSAGLPLSELGLQEPMVSLPPAHLLESAEHSQLPPASSPRPIIVLK